MRFHSYTFAFLSVAGLAASMRCAIAAAAAPVEAEAVKVELIAEHTALVPGQSQQFGLLLRHQPHWHTYWINPGDSGLPTTLSWNLPPDYKAGDIDWPVPKRFEVGGLYNFGYDEEVVLPVAITAPADAKVGSTAHIGVDAKWLVCREECVPGKTSLALDLPVVHEAAKVDPRWTVQFSNARLAQPQATAWKGEVQDSGQRIALTLRGPSLPPAAATLDAFAAQSKLFDNKPPTIRHDGDTLVIDSGKSEYFTTPPSELNLLLTTPGANGPRGWRVRVPFAATAAMP
jgi:thiol:disulfide interchange protein DsbD